jgi:hypothetical protein
MVMLTRLMQCLKCSATWETPDGVDEKQNVFATSVSKRCEIIHYVQIFSLY